MGLGARVIGCVASGKLNTFDCGSFARRVAGLTSRAGKFIVFGDTCPALAPTTSLCRGGDRTRGGRVAVSIGHIATGTTIFRSRDFIMGKNKAVASLGFN